MNKSRFSPLGHSFIFKHGFQKCICVGLQLGPVESHGTLPGTRPVSAIQMDCQGSGEKQPQNFKQIMLNGNKHFLPFSIMIWITCWLCVSGGQRKGEGERRAETELCVPVTRSPADSLGSLWERLSCLSLEHFVTFSPSFY